MKDYLLRTNIYEVNLRQYTYEGSLQAFIKHLPRLHDMGVQILWMMPIHPIGVQHRKGTLGSYYSIKDYYGINHEFGNADDFKQLISVAHNFGMKVIIDWVANHAAWDNVWTLSNPDFFVLDAAGNFKPPFDWDDVIQFDHSNISQQEAMTEAMRFWVDTFDIDGFRADLAHLTPLSFWKNARQKLTSVKADLIWLAETEDVSYYEAFDIIYAWKWMHATESFIKNNEDKNALQSLLNDQKTVYPVEGFQLYFTSNHDENSWNGTEYEKYGVYARALAVFNYVYPKSVPLIYSGQELPNYKRVKFFDKDEIEWNESPELHEFYKTLNLHHDNTFKNGDLKFLDNTDGIFAFSRTTGEQCVVVFLNLSKEKIITSFSIPAGTYKNLFSKETILIENIYNVNMEPGEYHLLESFEA